MSNDCIVEMCTYSQSIMLSIQYLHFFANLVAVHSYSSLGPPIGILDTSFMLYCELDNYRSIKP